MSITIIKHGDFSKYNVTTGAGTFNLPMEDVSAVYGPGWPIAPVPRPEDSEVPREIDYPVAVNATLQPRVGYEGLMPVKALKAAYTNVAEAATPVSLIIRELSSFVPMLKNKSSQQREDEHHPFNWLTLSPDRKTPFNVWMTRYKKSAKIYGAPAFFIKKDNNNTPTALEYIDGSTLFLIINPQGKLPEPDEVDPEILKYMDAVKSGIHSDMRAISGMPEIVRKYIEKAKKRIQEGKSLPIKSPAFTQIIKGIPFSFWDKSQIYFVPEPPSPSVDTPYGETYIERSWQWIQVIASLVAFELAHYRSGNMPEGFASMPKDWFPSMAKLAVAEREYNARMAEGSQTQHARLRFGPDGMKYIPTKRPDFPEKLYTYARHNIYYAIGVPTSEIGVMPSRGLGGKGFESGAAHDITRQILETEKRSLESAFNKVMLDAGETDATFYLDYPQEEIDPMMQQETLWNQLIHGVMTLNDILTAQNKDIIGDPKSKDNIANKHLIIAGQSIFVIEDLQSNESGIVAASSSQPATEGGSPVGPEDAALESAKAEHNTDDRVTLGNVVKLLEASNGRSMSTKSWSIPEDSEKGHARNKCFNCNRPPTKDVTYAEGFGRAWFCDEHFDVFKGKQKGEMAVNDIKGRAPLNWGKWAKALDAPNIMVVADPGAVKADCPEGYDENQWRMGMEEEQEHAETVGGDQEIIANIVKDHLGEDPFYYTHLQAKEARVTPMVKRYKAIGNRTVNIETGQTVPGGDHKNHADAIAHAAAMNINVKDVSKKADLVKFDWDEYQKHCGVCPEDVAYFNAPVTRQVKFEFPAEHHANDVEIVAMMPEGLESKPALWKPEGGENEFIQEKIGGPQYVREEAAWLLSQCLNFPMVPLAYVANINGENGAVVWYTSGQTDPRSDLSSYDPVCVERAAVLDYIMSQQDRGQDHNYFTHPDDPTRLILIDNGFSMPEDPDMYCESYFCGYMLNKPLSDDSLMAIRMCVGDSSMWRDIEEVLSTGGNSANAAAAVAKAKICAQRLLDEKAITPYHHVEKE